MGRNDRWCSVSMPRIFAAGSRSSTLNIADRVGRWTFGRTGLPMPRASRPMFNRGCCTNRQRHATRENEMKANCQALAASIVLGLLLAGCSVDQPAANESPANVSIAAPAAADAVTALPTDDKAAPGCAAHLRPALDEES